MPRRPSESHPPTAIEHLRNEAHTSSLNWSMTVRMTSKPLIEESKIEETIKSKPKEAFTVPDFIETLNRLYPEEWNDQRKGLDSSEKKEGTQFQRTFQTGLTYARINHIQLSPPSPGIQRTDSRTIGRPLTKKERLS